ncbi:MAG: YaaA family protein [Campylobacteraceae bacterium]|jgi:cytoplasmic iron level regulating protein YaaA (DUF328/UPF0246 family)|nr:YaaA family protein [Campylobacteraceae bacterium]
MLKILFSPSESKSTLSPHKRNLENSLWEKEEFYKRLFCINLYNQILQEKNQAELSKLFGLKQQSQMEELLPINPLLCPTQKAALRYDGVAYKQLNYVSLNANAQDFIDTNVMIFSNLLGPILAGDYLPYYKLKQGENLRGFEGASYYKEAFSSKIDEWVEGNFIVDLRASFYEKFYTLKKPHIAMKFYKEGKILSHFAKAYRGLALKDLAINRPKDEEEFGKIAFEGLSLIDIKKFKLKKEYAYEIKI